MKKGKMLLSIALFSLLITSCGCSKNTNSVITVNDRHITKAEYEKAYKEVASQSMFDKMGIDISKDPDNFLALMIKERVVNDLIVKELLDEEMEKKKIDATKEDINKALKEIIEKVGSKEKFNNILRQNGISNIRFKEDLKEEVKVKKLVDSMKRVSISDSDVKRYYENNRSKFTYPEKVRASHILVMANKMEIMNSIKDSKSLSKEEIEKRVESEMKERRLKAQNLHKELVKDKSQFEKLARENSDDPESAKQGGDLGFFAKEEMVGPFSKVAFSLKPGTISDIVETPYGYHIILVTDRAKAGTAPLDNVKLEIKAFLENQEKVKVLQAYVDKLKKEATIKFDDPSFNPEEIQKLIKKRSKENPELNISSPKKSSVKKK